MVMSWGQWVDTSGGMHEGIDVHHLGGCSLWVMTWAWPPLKTLVGFVLREEPDEEGVGGEQEQKQRRTDAKMLIFVGRP